MKTYEEYLESLRDGREVYYRGERVEDISTHPILKHTPRFLGRLHHGEGLTEQQIEDYFFVHPETGQRLEPIEEVVIDVDEEFSGTVVEKISARKGEMLEMRPSGSGKQRLTFHVPSRALIGYHGEFLTDTRGTGIINRLFHGYAPYKGAIDKRRNGTLISLGDGKAVAYALWNLEERGPMFINAGDKVYGGMIIGEHSRGNDLEVNPLKGKQLTNIRASGKDEAVDLTPPIEMGLDKAIAYIGDDELVEVTPQSIRLRKRYLDIHERKRHSRQAESA